MQVIDIEPDETEAVEKIVPIKYCVRFWESMLFHDNALLTPSTVTVIEATIKHVEADTRR